MRLTTSGRTGAPTLSKKGFHDHSVASRHGPLQIHDAAVRAAPVPGRRGRVPLQVPYARRRPSSDDRRDRGRDRSPHVDLLHRRGACVPGVVALHEVGLHRVSEPLSPEAQVRRHPSLGRIPLRDRHPHRGAVAAHDSLRNPGACDRQRGVLPTPLPGSLRRGGAAAPRRKDPPS